MQSRENINNKRSFFDLANFYFKIKSTAFYIEIEQKNQGKRVAHNRYVAPKVLKFLATSYLPCLQRVLREWTCSLLTVSITSQTVISKYLHFHVSLNVKLYRKGRQSN